MIQQYTVIEMANTSKTSMLECGKTETIICCWYKYNLIQSF